MKIFKWLLVLWAIFLLSSQACAEEHLKLQKVKNNIYAIVGELGNRTADNLGNNASFGFIITADGVVLVDSGGTYKGAEKIDSLIKSVTDKPVVTVINTGGQDHRWLGNGYFKQRGAHIIASKAAVTDQHARFQNQMFMLGNLVGTKALAGTDAVYADEKFAGKKVFTLGGVRFELMHVGPAHTPGDILVWLPKERVVFAGDVVYVDRMLGVLEHSDSRHWLAAYESMAALKPDFVVPGHGPATSLSRARADTYDYLVFLRNNVRAFIDAGRDVTQISEIDQSRFKRLKNYDTLKGRNAQQVIQAMEWE